VGQVAADQCLLLSSAAAKKPLEADRAEPKLFWSDWAFVPTLEGDTRLELPSSRFDTPDGAFPEDGNVWEEGKAAGNPWPTALLFVARVANGRSGSSCIEDVHHNPKSRGFSISSEGQ